MFAPSWLWLDYPATRGYRAARRGNRRLMDLLCAAMALAPPLLDPRAAASLRAGRAHQEHGFVPPALVYGIRRSLVALGRSERLRPATSFSSDGREDDLRSALSCKPDIGDDSMYALYERLDELREQLQQMLGTLTRTRNLTLALTRTRTRTRTGTGTRTRTRTGTRARARARTLARCLDAIPRSCSVCFRRPSDLAAIARGSRWSSSTLARSAS